MNRGRLKKKKGAEENIAATKWRRKRSREKLKLN